MSRNIYDNWEKLVGAVIRREKDRQLAYCDSISTRSSTYSTDFSSRFSFFGDVDELAGLKLEHSDPSSDEVFFPRKVEAIKYEELRKATGFLRLSMSHVYKGWIDEHRLTAVKPGFGIAVAVKKMNNIEEEKLLEWRDEMSHLRHPNLVTPIGYCFEEDQRILVYEFMLNGSLRDHLYGRGLLQPLPWETRIKVAVGAAKALSFLHSLKTPVVFGNLKSCDVLLDGNFNAKLSDVGLHEDISIPEDVWKHETESPYRAMNKYCPYAAPEYIEGGELSTKCDVYSYGILLSELIRGNQAFGAEEFILRSWAELHFRNEERTSRIMDTRLKGQYPFEQAFKLVKLALQCLRSDPKSRPSMAEVVAMLQKL